MKNEDLDLEERRGVSGNNKRITDKNKRITHKHTHTISNIKAQSETH